MTRLGAALLLVALTPGALSGCGPAESTALGQRPTTYPTAGSGTPTPAPDRLGEARRDALEAATAATEAILSYDYRSLDADLARATAFMTPTYRAQFRTLAGELQRRTRVTRLATAATVLRAGLQGISHGQARAVLFVEQLTSTEGSLGATSRTALVLTLQRTGSGWLVASLDTATPERQVAEPSRQRRAAMRAARDLARAYSNLSWQDARADVDRVATLATGDFRASWSAAAGELVRRTVENRATTTGTVVATGVEHATPEEAVVLVTAAGAVQLGDAEEQQRPLRLIVTLQRVDGRWLASDLALLD